MTLHDELSRLADTASRPTVDHSLWDRGRTLRRRDRLVTSAVVLVLVLILGGIAATILAPPRAISPADDVVPEGAIPSRIYELDADTMNLSLSTDLAIGRASVAFVAFVNKPVVIEAADGDYHLLDLPSFSAYRTPVLALSPDGRHLAWPSPTQLHVADLETGDVLEFAHNSGRGARVTWLFWQADSARLTWRGTDDESEAVAGTLDVTSPSEFLHPIERTLATGLGSPARTVAALPTKGDRPSALFVRPARPGRGVDSDDAEHVRRPLPADLYQEGASVHPLGWATDSLLLAEVNALNGSDIQGPHMALFTSPDRPKSEWTYRIVMRHLPPNPVSVAVDLIPDLDGTSSQQLTHDFGEPDLPGQSPWRDRLPALLGGLVALLAGLAYIRMLRRQ